MNRAKAVLLRVLLCTSTSQFQYHNTLCCDVRKYRHTQGTREYTLTKYKTDCMMHKIMKKQKKEIKAYND